MSLKAGGKSTFRIPREEPLAPECTSLACEAPAALTDPFVIASVVVIGLVAFIGFAYIRDARECCTEERRRVVDERDAFGEFADRVDGFDPTPMDMTTATMDGPVIGVQHGGGFTTPGDVRLRRVVDAYTDTVVSLPHYTEEYDETVVESLAAELGPDATATVVSGGTLSPELQSTIVARSRQASSSRSTLIDAIDAELNALSMAESELSAIVDRRDRLYDHLDGVSRTGMTGAEIDVWNQLGLLEDACDDGVEKRQQQLRDPPMTIDHARDDDDRASTFYQYLYAPLEDVSYPVLVAFTEVATRLRADRDELARRIAYGSS